MKVSKVPNRFFPDRAFTTEDLNRDLSHASNMIRNDQDDRYVYSSVRVPMATYSSKQKVGPEDVETGEIPNFRGDDIAGWKLNNPGNHEALRTFSFVPPMDMKLVSTDFYVKGGSEIETQMTYSQPMVAKVQWIVDDGGEGFPPRPPSKLPEGMPTSGDPQITRYHTQITTEITEQSGYFARTDNGEYTLRAGQCYRVMVSDPDIPSISTYTQSWFWRYRLAWIQLNFKYDKWQFDKINRPDVTFKNAKDKVEQTNVDGTGVYDQLTALDASRDETLAKKRYPKPELYWFGFGNINGLWSRPLCSTCVDAIGEHESTEQAVQNGVIDSEILKISPDLDFKYINDAGATFMDTKWAHNFQFQSVWRASMSPVTENVPGKNIWGYSVGMSHGMTTDMWGSVETEDVTRHLGFNFHAALGHGLAFNPASIGAPRNYKTWENNVIALGGDQPRQPMVREDNIGDFGGLHVGATAADKLYMNDTARGSTSIPECKGSADPRPGHASGFPGDYLAEIHSGTQYGTDPDTLPTTSADLGDMSVGVGTFRGPGNSVEGNTVINAGDSAGQNLQDELYLLLNTLVESSESITHEDQYRNFQKIYVLLWTV
tara:strand:- start:3138 stop:4940 length:1803 start_codon:yes stop_codon:yes gene_type:complete